jgi:serine protease AprX
MLASSTSKLLAADVQAQGSGLLNMRNVAGAIPVKFSQTWTKSAGTGTLEASRGDAHLILDGITLSGEKDVHGKAFNAAAMATAEAAKTSWNGGVWNGTAWTGSAWSGTNWAATTWTGSAWSGSSWAGKSWAVGTWTGSSWASTNWSGSSWAGSSWSGKSWAGKSWADDTWA